MSPGSPDLPLTADAKSAEQPETAHAWRARKYATEKPFMLPAPASQARTDPARATPKIPFRVFFYWGGKNSDYSTVFAARPCPRTVSWPGAFEPALISRYAFEFSGHALY